ncbi:MAG: thioredoxin family protein [Deltaproteobacteria bacterium]|nr:thioredoxin family protein [Deltaproteobacteria bacterium]
MHTPSVARSRAGFLVLAALALVLWPASSRAESEAPSDAQPVRASLIADVAQAGLGEELRVGVLLEMAAGWHVYWTFPGNTGKPTRVRFEADERFAKVLEPRFPPPRIFDREPIEQLSFGYAGSVLVMADAMVFEAPESGPVRIEASVSWLACKQACVPGKARLSLDLPTGPSSQPSSERARFDRVQRDLPASDSQTFLEAMTWDRGRMELRFVLPAEERIESFWPHWLTDGSCQVRRFEIEKDERGRRVALLGLAGADCLPGAGGVYAFRDGESLRHRRFRARAPADAEPARAAAEIDREPEAASSVSAWVMLLFALLGGLLLNVMPCVIPVVFPKILHVVRSAQKTDVLAERRRILWSNSLAYTAGVVITLLSLGAIVIGLKRIGMQVGWGFQFQNVWFLVFMISLLLVLGLGMLHVFPLKSESHAEDLKSLRQTRRRSPLLESFLTGLLVTFLGTPCTAPLLGPALGYAFTASPAETLVFLAAVGLGLSLPFLALGAWTGWTRVLPKRVTESYDRVMRGMAFLLFGTAVWLLGVLADGHGADAALRVLWFQLGLALAAWIFGMVTSERERWKRRLLKLLPLALAAALFGWWVMDFAPRGVTALHSRVGIRWEPFSAERLHSLKREGRTVFVDFTAEWCMNCKANERLVIETHQTRKLFDELHVATLKADATRFDPEIQAWLRRYGRAGVPMYLVFAPCSGDRDAALLPEILTFRALSKALRQAGPSRSSCEPAPP